MAIRETNFSRIDGAGPVGRIVPLGTLQGTAPPTRSPMVPMIDQWGNPWMIVSDGYNPIEWFYTSYQATDTDDAPAQFKLARNHLLASNGWLSDELFPVVIRNGEPHLDTEVGGKLYDVVRDDGRQLMMNVRIPMPDGMAASMYKAGVQSTDGGPLLLNAVVCRWTRVGYISGVNCTRYINPTSTSKFAGNLIMGLLQGLVQGAIQGYSIGGVWGAIIGAIIGAVIGAIVAVATEGKGQLTAAAVALEQLNAAAVIGLSPPKQQAVLNEVARTPPPRVTAALPPRAAPVTSPESADQSAPPAAAPAPTDPNVPPAPPAPTTSTPANSALVVVAVLIAIVVFLRDDER